MRILTSWGLLRIFSWVEKQIFKDEFLVLVCCIFFPLRAQKLKETVSVLFCLGNSCCMVVEWRKLESHAHHNHHHDHFEAQNFPGVTKRGWRFLFCKIILVQNFSSELWKWNQVTHWRQNTNRGIFEHKSCISETFFDFSCKTLGWEKFQRKIPPKH